MKKFVLATLAASTAATFAAPANAAIFIGVSVNGGAIVQVATDGGSGTANYNTTAGNFTYNVGATGFPILVSPNLLTQSVNIKNNNGNAQTVSVFITETDLSSFNGSLTSAFTSNVPTNSSTVISSYYSTGNALWGGTQLRSSTFNAAGTTTATDTLNLTGPFSATVRYDITFNSGRGGDFNGTANLNATAVPEPATWGMLMVGFGAMGFAMRRKKTTTRIRFA
ncbi:PEPxxWA-CTERM sorting domain-containing protein [Sphingomonas sp. RS2018]